MIKDSYKKVWKKMSKDFLSRFGGLPYEIKNKILTYNPVEEKTRACFKEIKRYVKIQEVMKNIRDEIAREELYFIQWFMYYVFSWIERNGGTRKQNLFLGENNTGEIKNYGMKQLCMLEEKRFESCMKFTRNKMINYYE